MEAQYLAEEWLECESVVLRSRLVWGARWQALCSSDGLLLSQSLACAGRRALIRTMYTSQVVGSEQVWDGVGVLRLLTAEVLDYLSKLKVTYRTYDRHFRKLTKGARRFMIQLSYAPARVRLGQLYRLMRILVLPGWDRFQTSRVIVCHLLGLWLFGNLSLLRRAQNLQLWGYDAIGCRMYGWAQV
jgi:hypothetical protein